MSIALMNQIKSALSKIEKIEERLEIIDAKATDVLTQYVSIMQRLDKLEKKRKVKIDG